MPDALRAPIKVDTRDGHVLAVNVSGAEDGWPVFLMHGTPGSRTGPLPRASVLYRLGVRLISYDRPGYGLSTRRRGRTVASAAADVDDIAAHLGISRFSVVGRSGGGPHALACAAKLPQVVRAAVMVSLAPAHAPGLNWFAGMTPDNVNAYGAADADPERLMERLRIRAARVADNPATLLNQLRAEMRDADLTVTSDAGIEPLLTSSYREALRDGADGWIDDVLAFRMHWGFELGSITVPVRLWHGEDDNFSPANHTLWLAKQIPNSEVHLQSGSAHFAAMEMLPRMLGWLAASRDQPAAPAKTADPSERVRIDYAVQEPAFAQS